MALDFTSGGERAGWLLTESGYEPRFAAKLESLFSLANGYMGVRAASEERSLGETRGFFVAGLFDAFPGEVTELANAPDWTGVELELAGEPFSPSRGSLDSYRRTLDLRDGTLTRVAEWVSPSGARTRLTFERFLSLADPHDAALRVVVEPIDWDGTITVRSGIDGQVTNSGVQHFREGVQRLHADGTITLAATTQESAIELAVAAHHRLAADGARTEPAWRVESARRRIALSATIEVRRGVRYELVKQVDVRTSRDPDARGPGAPDAAAVAVADAAEAAAAVAPGTAAPAARGRAAGADAATATERALAGVRRAAELGFAAMLERHRAAWRAAWDRIDVEIDGAPFDQLALRFALFHLYQMAPFHDDRASIAAKGLSGEGYKGHVFWDTEIFILPFFTFVLPELGSQLLRYRYRTLGGAIEKAREHGYRGAMYPWESALDGRETTPRTWGVDLRTGEPIRVWSGEIEQHITADVAYAIRHHAAVSGDTAFLLDHGLEILVQTARFWASRVERDAALDRYVLRDVMGPDEYGEHCDNNAFTSYMARRELEEAAAALERVRREHPAAWRAVAERTALDPAEIEEWRAKAERLFVNVDPASGFITQYDGFLEKREVDVARYRGTTGGIFRDFGWEEIKRLRITKQADAVMLLYLHADDFGADSKRRNFHYYEPTTLHDSSLSPAMHAIVAADVGDVAKAYEYFAWACRIDLGDDPNSSSAGLHAAALGGIWQAAVNGFGGVRLTRDGRLRVAPRLPASWRALRFRIEWRGRPLFVEIDSKRVTLTPLDRAAERSLRPAGGAGAAAPADAIDVEIDGRAYRLGNAPLSVELRRA